MRDPAIRVRRRRHVSRSGREVRCAVNERPRCADLCLRRDPAVTVDAPAGITISASHRYGRSAGNVVCAEIKVQVGCWVWWRGHPRILRVPDRDQNMLRHRRTGSVRRDHREHHSPRYAWPAAPGYVETIALPGPIFTEGPGVPNAVTARSVAVRTPVVPFAA